MSPDAPAQLEYADNKSKRRTRVRRWATRIAPVLVLGVVGYLWGPAWWDRAQTLYWQRRCLVYRAPADVVVVGARFADPWGQYPGPSVVPIEWTRFYTRVSSPGLLSRGTAFLHERRSPSGERMLVAADFSSGRLSTDAVALDLTFHARTFRLPGGARPAIAAKDQLRRVRVERLGAPDERMDLKLFAGQPDPADPSHFMIAFEYGEGRGVIDGWLFDNGDVLLEARPMVTPPPPTSAASPREPGPPPPSPAASRPAAG